MCVSMDIVHLAQALFLVLEALLNFERRQSDCNEATKYMIVI